MIINSKIDGLRDRIKDFLDVNEKVIITDLKTHLKCKSTDLLLALGGLVYSGDVLIQKENWKIIINKKETSNE
ncbi:MAG: hypothetical protein ACOC5T_01275 [Elusimicrobiota bacterium]